MDKNTLKKIISKYDVFIIFTFSILIISGIALSLKLDVNDELWNFQNIIKMNNGFEIYKDANVIITPLFLYIGNFLMQIFGATLITFRIYNILIGAIFISLVYIFLKRLNMKKIDAFMYTSLISVLIIMLMICGANYNALATIIFIIGTLLYIRENKHSNITNNILQGIIIFLIFLTKQNLVVYYIVGLIISELILNKSMKITLKKLIFKFLIAFVFLVTFLGILYLNNNLFNFINIAFLGMGEFATHLSISIESIYNIGFVGIIVIVSIMFITNKNINVSKDIKINVIKLLSLGLALELISYPIINIYHSMLGSILIYILAAYILSYIIDMIDNKYIIHLKKFIIMTLILIGIIYSTYCTYIYILKLESQNCNEFKVYSNCIINKELKDDLINVTNYIKEKEKQGIKVIVFSDKAALYMIPLRKNNGAMDLPFLGNMGYKGEQKMLENIKTLKNCEILIVNEEEKKNVFTQQSELIWNYITDNYPKIGEIEKFNIYSFQ